MPGDAGLDRRVQILGVDGDDAVHAAQVDAEAAVQGGHVPLQRGAGAERHDRDAVGGADPYDARHLLRRERVADGIRWHGCVVGLAPPMLVALRTPKREPIARNGGEYLKRWLRNRAIRPRLRY